MTVAKRDGRTGMAASLGGDTPAITARSLRHSTPPQMAKVELRTPNKTGSGGARGLFGKYGQAPRPRRPVGCHRTAAATADRCRIAGALGPRPALPTTRQAPR